MHEEAQKVEFDLLMESQYWPPERIRALRRERLEILLRHARANVPFYATRLDPLFRADGSIDWDRWGEIPTLKRSDLIDHRRALLARDMPPGHGRIGDIATSGSTGTPVVTSHTSFALAMTKAAVFRANVNDSLDFGSRLGMWAGLKPDIAAWPEGRRAGRWGPWWDGRAAEGEVFEINHLVPAEQVLDFMGRSEARYLLCGGTDARLLAHEAERLGIALSLDAILTRGTDATAAGRTLIAEVFGARTLALYSSKEGHRMAHSCTQCGGWHVNDEQVLVEIVDEEGSPVPVGQAGRVVITPLWGFAQPLIRYEQGDLATRGASSGCGRGHSIINDIVGRVRHMFVMPDGSRIVPDLPVAAVAALNATMFQVAQVSRELVEVRYVPRQNGATSVREPVQAALAGMLHPGISVSFHELEAFNVPPGRKHLEFVSELGGSAGP